MIDNLINVLQALGLVVLILLAIGVALLIIGTIIATVIGINRVINRGDDDERQ